MADVSATQKGSLVGRAIADTKAAIKLNQASGNIAQVAKLQARLGRQEGAMKRISSGEGAMGGRFISKGGRFGERKDLATGAIVGRARVNGNTQTKRDKRVARSVAAGTALQAASQKKKGGGRKKKAAPAEA